MSAPRPRTPTLLVVSLVAAGVFTSILSVINASAPEAWAHFAPYTILPALTAAAAVWLLRRRALWEQLAGAVIAVCAVIWVYSARTDPQWAGGLTLEGLGSWLHLAVFGLPILLIAAALWAIAVLVTRFAGRPRTSEAPGEEPVAAPEAVGAADSRLTLRLLAAGIAIGAGVFFAFCLVLNALDEESQPGLLIALACVSVLPGILAALATAGLPRVRAGLGAGVATLLALIVFTLVSLLVNALTDTGILLLPASLAALSCGLVAWWVLSAILRAPGATPTGSHTEPPAARTEPRTSARI